MASFDDEFIVILKRAGLGVYRCFGFVANSAEQAERFTNIIIERVNGAFEKVWQWCGSC